MEWNRMKNAMSERFFIAIIVNDVYVELTKGRLLPSVFWDSRFIEFNIALKRNFRSVAEKASSHYINSAKPSKILFIFGIPTIVDFYERTRIPKKKGGERLYLIIKSISPRIPAIHKQEKLARQSLLENL